MPLTVTTNHHRREVLDAWELTPAEREEFDYLDWKALEAGEDSASFFRYKGQLYDLSDMPMAPDALKALGWDGFASDTFWSGIAVRYFTEDGYETTGEYVVVGRVIAED